MDKVSAGLRRRTTCWTSSNRRHLQWSLRAQRPHSNTRIRRFVACDTAVSHFRSFWNWSAAWFDQNPHSRRSKELSFSLQFKTKTVENGLFAFVVCLYNPISELSWKRARRAQTWVNEWNECEIQDKIIPRLQMLDTAMVIHSKLQTNLKFGRFVQLFCLHGFDFVLLIFFVLNRSSRPYFV